MGYTAQLRKGAKTFYLDGTDGVALSAGFTPPVASEAHDYAAGTSANRYGGAELSSLRAANDAWSFEVRSMSTTNAGAEVQLRRLYDFLLQAGDDREPVYFEWRSADNVDFEPVWGQWNAYRRIEVVAAQDIRYWDRYLIANMRDRAILATVRVTIKPYPMGKAQQLGIAMGGVQEYTIGSVDGRSRGLRIPEATTNLFENPIFGHGTFGNGWTAGASLVAAQNTDPLFYIWGTNSAKLTAYAAAGAATIYRQSIDVGIAGAAATHYLSAYVRKPDGSAVTSSDVLLYYNAALAGANTTYQSLGNGWYWVYASAAGINAATNTGVQVQDYKTIYLPCVQVEQKDHPPPLTCGDMMGHSWGRDPHDSTSIRTAAYLRLPASVLNRQQFTVTVAWESDESAAGTADNMNFFRTSGGLLGCISAAGNSVFFSDSTNTISAADGLATHEKVVYHFTASPGSLKIYRNGAQVATGNTYTPIAAYGNYLYIGSNLAPDVHGGGIFYGFTIYDRAMSATEVLADYTNMAPLLAAGKRIDWMPWLWTLDGDGIADNCTDSTKENYAVAGGIPGTRPAWTEIEGACSTEGGTLSPLGLYLSHLPMDEYIVPSAFLFSDQSGTAGAGTDCGGEYRQTSVDTAGQTISVAYTLTPRGVRAIAGRAVNLLMRLYDVGANFQAKWGLTAGSYTFGGVTVSPEVAVTDYKVLSTTAASWLYLLPAIKFMDYPDTVYDGSFPTATYTFVQGIRSSGAAANVRLDYYCLMPEPCVWIDLGPDGFILNSDRQYVNWDTATSAFLVQSTPLGTGSVNLEPERFNLLMNIIGEHEQLVQIARTLTYRAIYVIPRWSIA